MLDHPVFIRMSTENNEPYFKMRSAAEVVVSTIMSAQQQGWLRLHGFVVLPEALEMVATPIRQGVAGLVGQLQAETIPLLVVLLPQAGMVWNMRYTYTLLTTQRSLDAQLNILLLAPVAAGIVESADQYPYSSANSRYIARVTVFSGFTNHPMSSATQTGEMAAVKVDLPKPVEATLPVNGAPPAPAESKPNGSLPAPEVKGG